MARTTQKKTSTVRKQLEKAFNDGRGFGFDEGLKTGQVVGYKHGRESGFSDALMTLGIVMIVVGLVGMAVESGRR